MFFTATMLSGPLYADIHPLDDIRSAARTHVVERLGSRAEYAHAEPGQLDRRLRLSRCDQPLDTFSAAGSNSGGNTSVGVRCPDSPGWTLYVPVRVEMRREVIALRHAMGRDSVLHDDDLKTIEVDVSRHARGYFTRKDELVGRTLTRAVGGGTVLSPAVVAQPAMVRRGQRVTLIAGDGPVAVRAPAEALSDGRRGQRVQVRNLSSGRVIEGVVRSPTEVTVQ